MDDFEPLARIDQLPDGATLAVTNSRGERICLVNDGNQIRAVQGLCAHQEFPLVEGTVLPGARIECAWHGAQFDLRTGRAMHPPAESSIAVYEVAVRDGVVLVGGRKE